MEAFKITTQMKKQELIETHKKLLDAYKAKAKEAAEAIRQAGEAQKHNDAATVQVAREATVHGVVETLGQLRTQLGRTVNDLTDQMTAQADTLESLNQAVLLQEGRLQELHDIEAGADALASLTAAYEERSEQADTEFAMKIEEMEKSGAQRVESVQAEYEGKKRSLARQTEELRASWEEETAAVAKTREREEAEYLYQRDRTRKLEEDDYQDKKVMLERELERREEGVKAAEDELASLRKEVEAFPKRMEKELEKARQEAVSGARTELDGVARVADVERNWEKKVLDEKIVHLSAIVETRDKEMDQLKSDLATAQQRVQLIADKAVEGASLSRAYQSVNKIALEQARKPDGKSKV